MLFYALSWGDYKDVLAILTNIASVIENVHHTQMSPSLPTALTVLRQGQSRFIHIQKSYVVPKLLFTTYAHIITK